MIRFPMPMLLLTAGLAVAQTPGGWRHLGDAPPAATQAQPQSNPEPVDPSDQSGQPAGTPAQAPDADAAPAAAPVPAPAPSQAPAPAPQAAPQRNDRPSYGLPRELTLRPGTYISMRINQPLSSDRSHEGDTFTGSLMQPVVVDGVIVALRGQTVYGRVAEVAKQHSDKPSRLRLELTSLSLVDGTQAPLQSQLVAFQGGTTPAGIQAGTVVGTTTVGAVAGGIAARGAGAAIGAGTGAAAGIIGVLLTRNHPTIVYPETPLTFQVTAPVTISTARAPQAFRFIGPEDYSHATSQQMTVRPRPAAPGPAPYYYGPGNYPGYYPGYYPYYPYYWGPSIGLGWGWGWGGWGWGGGWGGRRWR